MVVSLNRAPQHRPQHIIIRVMGTPNMVPLTLGTPPNNILSVNRMFLGWRPKALKRVALIAKRFGFETLSPKP